MASYHQKQHFEFQFYKSVLVYAVSHHKGCQSGDLAGAVSEQEPELLLEMQERGQNLGDVKIIKINGNYVYCCSQN